MSIKIRPYIAPEIDSFDMPIERGFAISDNGGFEQPEYGGADEL